MSERRPYGAGTLGVKLRADGSDVWTGRWYVDDPTTGGRRQVRRKVGNRRVPGSKVGLTKTQAEKRLAQMMAEEAATVPEREDARTLAWAADTMLAALVGVEPQTIDTYRRDFDTHLRKRLGDTELVKLTRTDYEGVVAAMVDGYGRCPDGYKPKTIQNVIRVASRIHNYGRGREPAWCQTNPAEGVELPKVEDHEDVPHLTQDELSRLLAYQWGQVEAALEKHPETISWAELDYAMWLVGAVCGPREGELIGFRRRDMKWLESKLSIRKNRTRQHGDRSPKSKAGRRDIPAPLAVVSTLNRLFDRSRFTAEDARVFGNPATGDPIAPKSMNDRLAAACKAAEVRVITMHGLRHTFGVQCARAGIPMRTLQEWMGHARISTTERYAKFAKDQQEVSMLEGALSALTDAGSYSESHSEQN